MAIRVEPYAVPHADAVNAFNRRLTARNAVPGFLLDDAPSSTPQHPALTRERFLALEDDEVRGGFLLQRQTFLLGGRPQRVANYQAPISEGIADRRYAYLGMLMVKEALRRDPFLFCLGMGGADRPLPRLLAALGFRVRTVPFVFRVHRATRVLRQLPALRMAPRRARIADLLATTGVGAVAFGLRARVVDLVSLGAPRLGVEVVRGWDRWADELWDREHARCSMVAVRDAAALTALYPLSDPRNIGIRLRHGERTVGWAVLYDTAMCGSPHFADLRVGTILDAWACRGYTAAVARAATRLLQARGVDLTIVNHAHVDWLTALRRVGYLTGPSNYVLAMSPALTQAVDAERDGARRMHLTRGDADGRIHL